MADVFVTVPSYDHKVWIGWVQSYVQTIGLLNARGHKSRIGYICGCPMSEARNSLVEQFLDSGCGVMLSTDADLSWDPRGAVRLVESPYDVIAGLYPSKIDAGDKVIFKVRGTLKHVAGPVYENIGGGVTGGLLCLKRDALLKMLEAYPVTANLDEGWVTHTFFNTMITEDGSGLSEDFAFCERWRQIGGRVYVDADINFGHFGTKIYAGILKDSNAIEQEQEEWVG